LKEYYHETGKNDLIIIEIPKGGYVPHFFSRNSIEQSETNESIDILRNKPVVAVVPFRNISRGSSRDFFADGLGEQLSTELTRFHDLSVISYYSSRHVAAKTSDVKEASILLGASYILTGSIQNDNKHLRIWAQVILGDTGKQLWANSFERNNTASGLFEIQNEIVRNILTSIGGYYGAIFRDVLKTPYNSQTNDIEVYDAIYWYYHYQKIFSKQVFQKAINALEAAVKADPNYALAWAMLGELYLDDKALEFKEIDNPVEQGLKCALRAITIDPSCQHGYLALAWVNLFLHNRAECLKAVYQCLAINPNSADMMGAMGFALTCAGEFEKGFKLLNDSILLNPFYPWWFNVGFVLYFLHKKEYKEALYWAEKINMPEILWDSLLKATALAHLNRTDEAKRSLEELIQLIPDTGIQVKDIMESFLLSEDVNREILEGLRKAGLKEFQTARP
jgi:TolB-like protein